MADGAEQLGFEVIFKKIKARLIDETTEMFKHKKSMKLKLGVKFEAGELELNPFEDEEEDETSHPDFESYRKSQMGKKETTKSYITNITEKYGAQNIKYALNLA